MTNPDRHGSEPSSLHHPQVKEDIRRRMNRVAGQMAAIQRMVEDEVYCIDILQQISAVRGALRTVATRLLEAHVDHCVYDAVASGSEKERREKVDELLEVFRRSIK